MSVLQAYQADLLKEMDECEGMSSDDIMELRRTADLALRATMETTRAIGWSMAAMAAAERHLWLTLSDIKDKDRIFLLDAPLAPLGLFGDAVDFVVGRHQEARRQAVAFGSASRCRSCPHESAGVKTERQEKCAFSGSENHLSGRCVGFAHDAGSFDTCLYRVDPHRSREGERKPVIYSEVISGTAGSDGSCVQHDTYWPVVHDTPTLVAQDQGVLPEGKTASHDQGHASDGLIPHRLGSGHEWSPCPWSVEWSPSHMAYQWPRDAGHAACTEVYFPYLRDE